MLRNKKTSMRRTPLNLVTWNVRTLLADRVDMITPQRRTVLIARELTRYNIDMAAVGENRLANDGDFGAREGCDSAA